MRKAIKLEFEDDSGSKYTLKIDGQLTRDKILKLVDIYELMNIKENSSLQLDADTNFSMVKKLISEDFNLKKFISKDVLATYEDKYNKTIKLSIISTYLRRLADEGYIIRVKDGRSWIYTINLNIQKHLRHNINIPLGRKRKSD